jgi:hypothetical protein
VFRAEILGSEACKGGTERPEGEQRVPTGFFFQLDGSSGSAGDAVLEMSPHYEQRLEIALMRCKVPPLYIIAFINEAVTALTKKSAFLSFTISAAQYR